MVKNNYGACAEAGILSAVLAKRGFTGPPDILDGDEGFWRMYGSDRCDFDKMVDRLGEYHTVMDIGYKAHAACW